MASHVGVHFIHFKEHTRNENVQNHMNILYTSKTTQGMKMYRIMSQNFTCLQLHRLGSVEKCNYER